MAYIREWKQGRNSRGYDFHYLERKHVNLKKDFPDNVYLKKTDIPSYPKCVFKVSSVCHVTEKSGLEGIISDEGFRGRDNFLWFNLAVTDDDVDNAEQNYLDSLKFSWQSPSQKPFLKKFTTSPAFQRESRYGNFCFTFKLRKLLNLYSKQFCEGKSPILRVLDTKIYKQEVAYSVLVHPRDMTQYKKYPRLPISAKYLCGYRYGKMSWRCQSPSNNYTHSLEVDEVEGVVYASEQEGTEFFVWDNVSVAFHMEQDWKLPVSRIQLFQKLSVCETVGNLLREPKMSVPKAEEAVDDLKRRWLVLLL